jgi:hypothetical protein
LVAGGSDGNDGQYASSEIYYPATGTWSFTGDLITARFEQTAISLPDGKVLIAGGLRHDLVEELQSAELYDPVTQTWSSTDSLNVARVRFPAVLLPSGMVLVEGGDSPDIFTTASAELYDAGLSFVRPQ